MIFLIYCAVHLKDDAVCVKGICKRVLLCIKIWEETVLLKKTIFRCFITWAKPLPICDAIWENPSDVAFVHFQ